MANGTRARGTGRKSVFIPPGGFAGFSQQTPATQAVLSTVNRSRSAPRGKKRAKKKRVAKRRAAPKRTRRKATRKASRMVKGSAAAKRHMAKLRKMRRR
jgi:hypothetical protein